MFKADFKRLKQLKQVFKKLLRKLTFNRLKLRFNRLNDFSSYTNDSKSSFKAHLPAKWQTTDCLETLICCFSLCIEKLFNL